MSESVKLTVTGMKCGGCENTVKAKLNALDGVKSVQADHKLQQVAVEFEAAQTNVEDIKQAIIAAGYGVG